MDEFLVILFSDKRLFEVRTKFIEGVNVAIIQDLLDDMQHVKVLNDGEVEDVKEGQTRTKDKARCLIDMVRKKGAAASEKFISRIEERDPSLYHTLQLDSQPEADSVQHCPHWALSHTQQTEADSVQHCPYWALSHTKQTEADSIYKIQDKASRQRLALIINNIEFEKAELKRNGAQQDQDQMKKLLEELGYSVELHNDQSAQEMESTLSLFSQREEHTKSDSTFVVLMSHGVRDGICGKLSKDEKTDILKTDKIFDIFNTKNCAGLRGKPKVIIIQACRGGEIGLQTSSIPLLAPVTIQDPLEDDCLRKEHKEKDFICFCSSTPDTKSWRDPVKGTIFIQRLVETFCKNACRDHIEELFRKVQSTFQDFQKQMPTRERTTLLKKFYLFPGN
ncbi:caspase-1-like [Acipenser oxyrinchus oxyrinchus]|uniref:Caspase-1-like n=1 Tax=Acipenser oxyrinchus oxyrinchus TaxID=40147 RepID=A0AAD8CXK2_ACIOX|nr:caspase-1-like [Acipenser oxyrinchus oxyrinchus]